ncbi:helix-turn-helix domain-containing protein [Paenibacillus sp. BC26]|uniref:helix-turn-helix domain-containing protein n=1 Tax=Paenibacillus sp. BC26 TaxID=1881032 RepID=UPI0008F2915E|nr:helix-turn-helix transcriptional regulator [Paenibacillus sp. BC26]SFT06136.1 DNA-binding transcriptional regulator, XRE-family HTH domain [Paenibacillus sp. BC26]
MANILVFVGAKIRELRNQKGWTQEQLAEKAGFYYTYIGSVERGEKNISLLNLQKIADALQVEVNELFAYAQEISVPSSKEKTIIELFEMMLKLKLNDLKKIKTIVKEFLE